MTSTETILSPSERPGLRLPESRPGTPPRTTPLTALPGAGRTTCVANLQPDLVVVSADEHFHEQFGLEPGEATGRNLYDLLHPGSPAVLDRHFARLAEGGQAHFAERVLANRGTDAVFTGELTGIAVRGEEDELAAIVVLVEPDEGAEAATRTPPARWPSTGRRKSLLTHLDAKILEGVAAGASTVQLATRMYMSRQGVEYHVGTMLRKLRVSNRAALVSRAYSMGLLVPGSWPPRVATELVGR